MIFTLRNDPNAIQNESHLLWPKDAIDACKRAARLIGPQEPVAEEVSFVDLLKNIDSKVNETGSTIQTINTAVSQLDIEGINFTNRKIQTAVSQLDVHGINVVIKRARQFLEVFIFTMFLFALKALADIFGPCIYPLIFVYLVAWLLYLIIFAFEFEYGCVNMSF